MVPIGNFNGGRRKVLKAAGIKRVALHFRHRNLKEVKNTFMQNKEAARKVKFSKKKKKKSKIRKS